MMGKRGNVTVIVPMKPLSQAKSRLRVPAELGSPRPTSSELATAFLEDVIRATTASQSVSRTLLTSTDLTVEQIAGSHGIDFLSESPGAIPDKNPWSKLNAAAVSAVADAFEDSRCSFALLVPGDLAALRPKTIEAIVRRTTALGASTFVRDHTDTGTTMLCVARAHHVEPAFGGESAAAHARAGAIDITTSAPPDARLDVDTWADLIAAQHLGLGANCQQLLSCQP